MTARAVFAGACLFPFLHALAPVFLGALSFLLSFFPIAPGTCFCLGPRQLCFKKRKWAHGGLTASRRCILVRSRIGLLASLAVFFLEVFGVYRASRLTSAFLHLCCPGPRRSCIFYSECPENTRAVCIPSAARISFIWLPPSIHCWPCGSASRSLSRGSLSWLCYLQFFPASNLGFFWTL